MTWQRIDDDTYIDDTLVTCAEYQLFIDEMREQGKYYQPDHWISPRFSDGDAKNIILGVRFSDAENFSNWLSQKNNNSLWTFRLPNQYEANNYKLNNSYNYPIGYWISDVQEDGEWENILFSWVGSAPEDARNLIIDPDDQNINRCDIKSIRNSPLNLNHPLVKMGGHHLTLVYWTEFCRYMDLKRTDNHIELFEIGLEILRNAHRGRAGVLVEMLLPELFTLQERIAGRSPAFEGIRLVKERIK